MATTAMKLVIALVAIVITWKPARFVVSRLFSRLFLNVLQRTKGSSSCKPDGYVSDLFVHPVKSLRAVSLQTASLDEKGLVGDRRFMVVYPLPIPAWKKEEGFGPTESTHRFLTQRQCPSLATIVAKLETSTTTNGLLLERGNQSIRIDLSNSSNSNKETTTTYRAGIWGDQVLVTDMGDEAAAFLQAIVNADKNCRVGDEGESEDGAASSSSSKTFLYQKVRLVCQSAKDDRRAPFEFAPSVAQTLGGKGPPVSLTDGFPVLMACQTSLDELNEKLIQQGKDAIPMSRFRPNIVIEGTSKAFEEDNWKVVAIGEEGKNQQIFCVVKACPRCKQSCTDQQTGAVSSEPVTTMKSFRALGAGDANGDVYFAYVKLFVVWRRTSW